FVPDFVIKLMRYLKFEANWLELVALSQCLLLDPAGLSEMAENRRFNSADILCAICGRPALRITDRIRMYGHALGKLPGKAGGGAKGSPSRHHLALPSCWRDKLSGGR